MWRKPFQYVYAQIVSDNNSESVTKTRYIIFNIITEKKSSAELGGNSVFGHSANKANLLSIFNSYLKSTN